MGLTKKLHTVRDEESPEGLLPALSNISSSSTSGAELSEVGRSADCSTAASHHTTELTNADAIKSIPGNASSINGRKLKEPKRFHSRLKLDGDNILGN